MQMDKFRDLNCEYMEDTFIEIAIEEGHTKGDLKWINYMRIKTIHGKEIKKRTRNKV